MRHKKLKIAIVGSGISGSTAAYLLSESHDITLYEKNDYMGGHVNTVDVEGSVEVDGGYVTTEVDGTVDVNLEAINGQYNVFYDRGGNEFYHRIPVYTFD